MSLEGAYIMIKKLKWLLVLLVLFLISCSCDRAEVASKQYSDVGIRVDGTAKLIVETDDPLAVHRWIVSPDYLPIDDCVVNYDVYTKIGDVWVCKEMPESCIEILEMGDKIKIKIIDNGRVLIGWCTIEGLSKTLLCGDKFKRQ